jgi:hypothetical protein
MQAIMFMRWVGGTCQLKTRGGKTRNPQIGLLPMIVITTIGGHYADTKIGQRADYFTDLLMF